MFALSLILYKFYLKIEISLKGRSLLLRVNWNNKSILSIEKFWPKHKACAICKEKYELEDQTLNLCDECTDEFMVFWTKYLKR